MKVPKGLGKFVLQADKDSTLDELNILNDKELRDIIIAHEKQAFFWGFATGMLFLAILVAIVGNR